MERHTLFSYLPFYYRMMATYSINLITCSLKALAFLDRIDGKTFNIFNLKIKLKGLIVIQQVDS